MKPLLDHIQRQQSTANALWSILEEVETLRRDPEHQKVVTALLVSAGALAAALSRNLQAVNLPKGGDA